MRAHRRGHIINISSVGGLIGNPSGGYYCATKFAVEGLTEALAKEVEPLGIRVTSIEPGPFRTDWAGRSLKQARDPMAAYADTAGARRAEITGRSGRQAGDPVRAADAIIKVVGSSAPPLNLILGKNGLERVRAKLAKFIRGVDEWEPVTLSADFPEP
jgi:NAD(P)-dependent dehydrogenase (short-subunit alcohol dehydrogenase family)